MRHTFFPFIVIVTLSGVSVAVHAESTPAETISSETPLIKSSELTLTVADYQKALLGLPFKQRSSIGSNPATLREFLLELYTEERVEQEAQRLGLPDQPEIQAQLQMARRKVLVNAVITRFKADIKSPDFTELAQEYYQTHSQEFTQPEKLQVAHILLKSVPQCACDEQNHKKRERAEALLTELRGGADFGELARKNSEDELSARQGGLFPQLVTRGMLVKPFEDAAFALAEPGTLSEVVETPYGYHIIKLISRDPAQVWPFEKVRSRIVEKMTQEFQAAQHKDFVTKFYPDDSDFNQAAINALFKAAPVAAPVAPLSPPPAAR